MQKEQENTPEEIQDSVPTAADSSEDTSTAPDHAEPEVIMEWITTAYRQTEKSKAWYAMMGVLVLIFVIYGLFSDSYGWIVSITFLLLAGVYYLTEMKPVPTVKVTVSDHGIRFGGRYFTFNEIKSFWIITDEGVRNLHLSFYKGAQREVVIMIAPTANVAKLRDYLLQQIPEEEGKKDRFSDQLIRNLGL